jgi:hypothetical protein
MLLNICTERNYIIFDTTLNEVEFKKIKNKKLRVENLMAVSQYDEAPQYSLIKITFEKDFFMIFTIKH